MKKLLINIILFFLIAIVVGEVVVRLTHTMSDIPQRTIDEHGIQKYFPNQNGYWKGGDHQWVINKLGWPGELPQSYDNLIMVIGDSFIENFMNPNECHQSAFLKTNMKDYNFMEAARAGVSLIEAMEISKQMDSLLPVNTLIYVNDTDFYESITEVKPMSDITQLNIKTNTIVYGEMKAPGLKKILYNWKLMYYFYNRFPLENLINKNTEPKITHTEMDNDVLEYSTEVKQLIDFIKQKYTINDKTLVFHPNVNPSIIEICKNAGFGTILLDSSNDNTWTFDYDHHWTCYGHEKAAEQVASYLKERLHNISEIKSPQL
ncbi:hypothetical protein [Winogradskyella sp. Asnod2-B02-A]|uniref:hypothetical protein n=1 Tax=Winogradskyella sp. Asnod2-B02-A TaxID=3160583 RepID=UPI0038694987